MIEDRDLRAALDSIATSDLKGAEANLSDEDLASYVAGDLQSDERERIQAVLIASPRMRARLLTMRKMAGLDLPGDDEGAAEDRPIEILSDREKAREFALLQARLGGPDEGNETTSSSTPSPLPVVATSSAPVPVPVVKPQSGQPLLFPEPVPEARQRRRPGYLIAASLLCAVLGGFLFSTSVQLKGKTAPTGFVDVRYLARDGATRGPGDPVAEMNADRDRILLQLEAIRVPIGEPPFDRYRVEIVDRAQAEQPLVWSQDDFPAEPDGTLNLLLDRGFIEPGRYQVKLFGSRGQENLRQLATYSFDL